MLQWTQVVTVLPFTSYPLLCHNDSECRTQFRVWLRGLGRATLAYVICSSSRTNRSFWGFDLCVQGS